MAFVRTGSAIEPRDRGQRGLVEDMVDARGGAPARLEVPDVALEELEAVDEAGQVLPLPRHQVVEDADGVPAPDERLGDVRADEARPARHEKSGHGSPVAASNIPEFLELGQDFPDAFLERLLVRLEDELGLERLFVGVGDAGELLDLAPAWPSGTCP